MFCLVKFVFQLSLLFYYCYYHINGKIKIYKNICNFVLLVNVSFYALAKIIKIDQYTTNTLIPIQLYLHAGHTYMLAVEQCSEFVGGRLIRCVLGK